LNEFFQTTVEYLKGVGLARATALKKELGIATYGDLLQYFPFKYIDRTRFYKVKEASADWPCVQIIARLTHKEIVGEKAARRLVAAAQDDTGPIELVWFQGITRVFDSLIVGKAYIFFGKPGFFNGKLQIAHPETELYNTNPDKSNGSQALQPAYTSTEKLKKFLLDSKGIQKLVANLLEQYGKNITENLPPYILEENQLIERGKAFRQIHFPDHFEQLKEASKRLKFEELFFLQLKLLKNKLFRSEKFKGNIFGNVSFFFNEFYKHKLPFTLTSAQKRTLKEIRSDTQKGVQMNRLLQGDVGSGKTVIALMSILLALDNGFQACMMAPTEILANQHFQSVKQLLGEGFVEVALLTGSTTKKARRTIHEDLESGKLHILIGTHALIEDKVQFKNLGFVVIDEQHRFGVEQRAKLWRKNSIPPHILVMTATPIPRTLAMTLYGDLDISVIDELPAGRKPIETKHFFEGSRLRVFGFMKNEIAKGRQVYVVYPLIKESEKLDLKNLMDGIEVMSREFPLPEYRISIVHGQLAAADKAFEMQRFVKGETQIMVATTVIEVGVNVPNASIMVIENAERFGLSQLHQLRGRVGRGAEQSFCILMSSQKLSKDGRTRLETMVRTNDGFEIAEIDLQLRGPGNIEGKQQSGVLDLKLANLMEDQDILLRARQTVEAIFEEDPQLVLPKNQLLQQHFSQQTEGLRWNKIS